MQSRDEWRQEAWDRLFDELAARWKGRLHLRDWDITYSMGDVIGGDPEIEAHCSVHRELGRRATIAIADRVAEECEHRRESVLVHELVHVVLDELCWFVQMHLPEQHQSYFRRLVEMAVSDVGEIILDLAHPDEDEATETLAREEKS